MLSRLIAEVEAEFVVLIGSWARGTQSDSSDVDVLVGLPSRERCPSAHRIHTICLSSAELSSRAHDGDDVAQWCLRYGVPLSGRERWTRLRERLLKEAPWPDPIKKLERAKSQFSYAESLLHMGDREAAQEELRIGLGHLARGLLLRAQVFPLSRPELPDQVRSIGLAQLARRLDQVAARSLEASAIEESLHEARDTIGQHLAG